MAGNNPCMVLISGRNNKNQSPGSLNAELLTLLVWMGVHPKVFPDCMHTSVRRAVVELRQVLRVTLLLVFLAGMPIVPCDNYFWRKGWATRWVGFPPSQLISLPPIPGITGSPIPNIPRNSQDTIGNMGILHLLVSHIPFEVRRVSRFDEASL
ncbi:hypothetical protein Bca52824_081174 [Brassica carinata]|uniref:Uncharacterized protein n=1 Tax=Brassica carinata TaxID=52824 RepID=A0A8X7PHE2_BRACI|nr:hypothetical protein Bca52824_081174 [Brassica carinata]